MNTRLTLVLLAILAVVLFLSATQVDAKKRCTPIKVCKQTKKRCTRRVVRRGRCLKTAPKYRFVTRRVCLSWKRNLGAKGTCVKCLRVRNKRVKQRTGTKCVRFAKKRVCTATKFVCTRHKIAQKCYVKAHPFTVYGPKKCKAGKMLLFKRVNARRVRRYCAAKKTVHLRRCFFTLDPHAGSQGWKSRFEFQHSGDWRVMQTSDGAFEVHARFKRFSPRWTGTIGFSTLVNGRDVVEYQGGKFKLNGKAIRPALNRNTPLPHGGRIYWRKSGRSNYQVYVYSPNHSHVYFYDLANHKYGNLYLYAPSYLNMGGVCAGKNARGVGLFNVRMLTSTKIAPAKTMKKFTKAQKHKAAAVCRKAGMHKTANKVDFRNCVRDLLIVPKKDRQKFAELEADVRREKCEGRRMHRD